MARVQLALNVDDLTTAIDFYRRLFGAEPAKIHDGYANFAIADPPLKLVLIENQGQGGTLNHLGVEVASPDEVVAATTRLQAEGLDTTVQEQTTCCYAVQDKVWAHGPDELSWEVYTVLADADTMRPRPAGDPAADQAGHQAGAPAPAPTEAACCAAGPEPVTLSTRTCC